MIVRRLGLVLVVALLPSIPSVSIKIAGIRAPGSDGKANVIPGRTSSPSVKPAELAVRLDERCKRRVDVRADMAGAINGRRHFWAEKGAAVFEDLDLDASGSLDEREVLTGLRDIAEFARMDPVLKEYAEIFTALSSNIPSHLLCVYVAFLLQL